MILIGQFDSPPTTAVIAGTERKVRCLGTRRQVCDGAYVCSFAMQDCETGEDVTDADQTSHAILSAGIDILIGARSAR